MKKLTALLVLSLILASLSGCYSLVPPPSDPTSAPNTNQQDAREALLDFFQLLHQGDYQSAAARYDGSYEWLIEINPDIPSTDRAALLESACRFNGFTCLEVLNAEAVLMQSSTSYTFEVEFQLEDGSLFSLGPCCGATETEMPPQSSFRYQVQQREDGSWAVSDLPPYVP